MSHLTLADDFVLVTNNPADLQVPINDLNSASYEINLKINSAKIKVRYNELIDIQNITIENTTLGIVDEFVYLKQLIHKQGSVFPETN